MSGGITQLVSQGIQDKVLVGDPQVSFFKTNYKRHTNFSQSVDRLIIKGNPAPGVVSTVRLGRNGDMVNNMYMTVVSGTEAVERNWGNIIDKVELLIGGQVIDTHEYNFTDYLAVDLLAQNLSKSFLGSHYTGGGTTNWFYPLRFFCCENWQSSLPLVALQYHDVDVRITWTQNYDVANKIMFYANYVFLDNTERLKFSTKPQEMLIYQVQKSVASNETVQNLHFNHPVKFIAAKSGGATSSSTCQITFQINGTEPVEKKYAKPHFTCVSSYYHAPFSTGNIDDYFLYSFCLDTSSLQPSGTLNFSRIDSARFISDTAETFSSDFYAVNYNVLKIENGMGGILYSD